MKLSILAALSSNGVIGRDNDIPWRQSNDLKRLKTMTLGHHVIMGRRTFDSVGKALPGRTNIVITRQQGLEIPNATVVHSLEAAVRIAAQAGETEAFVLGGAEIYAQANHRADRMYLTRVHAEIEGDTYFPEFDDVSEWHLTDAEHFDADEQNQYPYSFLTYDRAAPEGHAIPEE
ncbi:MAG TPA: dihydrofolate reductase [Thermoanaerobaculia bacterium]|nr:dihydrofolate reductase [Thermoanaerobaculia bacterium]